MRMAICALAFVVAAGLCTVWAWAAPPEKAPDKTKADLDRLKGMKAAVADVEKGVLKQVFPPAPADLWQLEYAKLLKKECGVETTIEGFEDAPKGGPKATDSYNDVMRVEIEHRFGKGTLDRLRKRAEESAEKKDETPAGVQVFVHPEKLTAKDKLTDRGSAIEIKSETTLVWIDLSPGARFAHATKYVLISADGTRVVDGTWWPVLNGKDLFRNGTGYKVEFPIKLSEK
jgi:hypothetical protein